MNGTGLPLQNKVALVTGGRSGIGRGVALSLARAGADVVVCDILLEDGMLEESADLIRAKGRRALAEQVDISSRDEVAGLADRVIRQFGKIDILVNNAAVMIRRPLLDLDEDEWDRMMGVNLKGYFLCSRAIGRGMVEAQGGSIINIGSSMGVRAGLNRGAYSISKAGVIMMTKVLAGELAFHNIRVNSISPHMVKTEFSRPVWSDPEALRDVMKDVPLGFPAEPDDIGKAAVFLASDRSRYITGHNLFLDGGWLI